MAKRDYCEVLEVGKSARASTFAKAMADVRGVIYLLEASCG